jgi:predicted ATPase
MYKITRFLDDYLIKTGRMDINPVEANELLARAGILPDSRDRPGKPLRDLLRQGKLSHAFQAGGKGSKWIIPHSSQGKGLALDSAAVAKQEKRTAPVKPMQTKEATVDISDLKNQLEKARQKYKPELVRYLLVAEAPPDSLERFFYYDNVRQHDYLFLGVAEALYPKLKAQFISSGRNSHIKKSVLEKFQEDGFYLLDLSELPLSLLDKDLRSQLPDLFDKINAIIDDNTHIILIKANVYDIAFPLLKQKFENVIDQRIPFPGQGGQRKFQDEFKRALRKTHNFE